MAIHFQPKIIIGSVVGFLTSAIGVIAIFFPSLFNLEQKKIADYSYSLNTLSDANKFINFLKDHQGGIVHLNITYLEKERYRDAYDKNGNIIIDPDADIDGTPKKENLNFCAGSTDPLEGKESYGAVDSAGHIFVKSQFKCLPFLNDFNFLRKKGEIGIWINGKERNGSDDKNYRIIITEDSRNNTLFKWSIKDRKRLDEMELSGNFFVEDFVDAHNYDNNTTDTIYTMSPQWRHTYSGLDQIGNDNITVIQLQPLSKKEIESNKY